MKIENNFVWGDVIEIASVIFLGQFLSHPSPSPSHKILLKDNTFTHAYMHAHKHTRTLYFDRVREVNTYKRALKKFWISKCCKFVSMLSYPFWHSMAFTTPSLTRELKPFQAITAWIDLARPCIRQRRQKKTEKASFTKKTLSHHHPNSSSFRERHLFFLLLPQTFY